MWQRIREEFFPKRDNFDLARGVRTSGVKSAFLQRLLTGRDYRRYQGVQEEWFRDAVRDVPRWTFIDMGCGRGKAMILASEAGFRKLIGVEFSASLCRDARRNMKKLGITARILCQDATTYTFPDEPCVVFFYNPFGPQLMQQVLRNLGDVPRILVYVNALHKEVFSPFKLLRKSEIFCSYST